MESLSLNQASLLGAVMKLGESVQASIVRVIDGDTFRIHVDAWKGTPIEEIDVRVRGIDTPEIEKQFAKCELELERGNKAKEYAQALLPPGTVVRLLYKGADKYFRVGGAISLPDGRDYAETILAAKLAKPYTGQGPKPDWCTPDEE